MVEYVLQVARNTGGNVCSMLADLRKGSRTEIDAINGKVIELGHKHGLDTPCNSFVHAMIKTLQERKSLAPL
jgi:2-dehydropantoate 2-reductase